MITENLKWYQKKNGVIILLIIFAPIGLYQMFKNKIWTLQTRVIISLCLFFPYGLYVMWKEKNLWNKKIKITISVLIGIISLSGGGVKGNLKNEYRLTYYESLMESTTRIDVIMKFDKLVKDPKYKGEYEYIQIHNGGSDLDLYYTGKYTYVKSSDGKESLVLVPTYKNGKKMDYSWADGTRDNMMILLIEDNDFLKLKFEYNGPEGKILTKK